MSAKTAKELNNNCHSATIDRDALELALHEQGQDWHQRLHERCPHLFASTPLFISSNDDKKMRALIEAVSKVTSLPAWRNIILKNMPSISQRTPRSKGVFFGYDFHLNAEGVHLIEINTNAGGAMFNALEFRSQCAVDTPGKPVAIDDLEQAFIKMFLNEWRLERGSDPLKTIAIVDNKPHDQYFYPEFLLIKELFEHNGITTFILDPSELEARTGALYFKENKIDLIYNRLTDFLLQQHATINTAYLKNEVVLTPHPYAYALYADKRNLALLTTPEILRSMNVKEENITTLVSGIPETRVVEMRTNEYWRSQRKQWFFKPIHGYGGKGAYRGANITNRVFNEIMQGGYIAQRMSPPGEKMICVDSPSGATLLKSDVRCYVYDGQVQLIAARLYQGQTTNFRTVNGGFAPVRIID